MKLIILIGVSQNNFGTPLFINVENNNNNMEKSFFLGFLPGQVAWVELVHSTLYVCDSEMRSENERKEECGF